MRRMTGITTALAVAALAASMVSPASALGGSFPAALTFSAKAHPGTTAGPLATRTDYRNPVSKTFADTFADPSVIRGKDGYWYSYGTSDPLLEGPGQPVHRLPIARSRDLVSWKYAGDTFTTATLPSWAEANAGIWAPDIRYVDGQYRMYYVVTETKVTGEPNDNAIGMATAPTPVGPWKDSGAPVVGPRRGDSGNAGDFKWTFDPTVVTDADGSQHIFYGSYYGGIWTQRLTDNGRATVGDATMVAIDNKFEGAYVVRQGGYWYLFASTANCCGGPTTGYSVQVGRSRSLSGPYVDKDGVPLVASRAGGTPVLMQNGNRWIGSGHNAIATDLAGQDWILYHAIDRNDPYLNGTDGINERPMLVDRLDWVGGWPYVRAGQGPSDTLQRGPATGGYWFTRFSTGIPARWDENGDWTTRTSRQTGTYAFSQGSASLLSGPVEAGARVEADLRSTGARYGLVAYTYGHAQVRVLVDPATRTLRLQQVRHGRVFRSSMSRLSANFDARAWHSVVLQVKHGVATASVTHARLKDPLAVATLVVPGAQHVQAAGALTAGAGVGVDNLSVLPPANPVTRIYVEPLPNRLDTSASDEFNGSAPKAGWSWANDRRDAAATVTSGVLRWPVEDADLVGDGNNASVLLRQVSDDVPWTIETKLTIDLGVDAIRNYQQGGLIAYVNDDLFTRFSHVAIWNTRQTEFGKEMPYAGRTSYGGTIVGPPAETTYLRITHRVDPKNGEHELRAWSRQPGKSWVKGGLWTLPAGSDIKVGLISHGRQTGERATSRFDYFRLYR